MNRSFGCVIQRSGGAGGEFTQPSVHLFAHPLYSEGIFLEEYEKDYIKIFVFRCGEAIMAADAVSECGGEGGKEQKKRAGAGAGVS